MTLSPWLVYLWGIADNVRYTALILTITLGIVGLFMGMFILLDAGDENKIQLDKWLKRIISVLVVSLLALSFVPDSKSIAVIVIAPAIVNSKVVQEDVPELYSIAIEALKMELRSGITNVAK